MSCWRQREEATGVGGNAIKAVDEDDNDENRWTEDDDEETDAGSRHTKRKNAR